MPAENPPIVLVEQPGETSLRITAAVLANGDLQIAGQDIGKAPSEVFGDSDYEYWLTVAAAHKDALLLALIEAHHTGDARVVSKMKALLEARRIPCTFSSF